MSKFAAVTIAALMLMAVFVSSASAAASVNTVEVRSPVYSGSALSGLTVDFDYTEFAGFYYDIDDNIGSETLSIDPQWSLIQQQSMKMDLQTGPKSKILATLMIAGPESSPRWVSLHRTMCQ